ncbi:hypothetical protein PAXRUDRAFT_165949, partial [Paxillus rubicundulus Ve08.2h10]
INFKLQSWTNTAAALSNPSEDIIKTSKQCKEKWNQVSKTYVIVHRICNVSEQTYSLKHGVNIGPQDEAVWDKFLKVHTLLQTKRKD